MKIDLYRAPYQLEETRAQRMKDYLIANPQEIRQLMKAPAARGRKESREDYRIRRLSMSYARELFTKGYAPLSITTPNHS